MLASPFEKGDRGDFKVILLISLALKFIFQKAKVIRNLKLGFYDPMASRTTSVMSIT